MSDVLGRIIDVKRQHVASRKSSLPEATLAARLGDAPAPRGFAGRLIDADQEGRLALIAEIKKASPSKGLIRADFDPPTLARAYRDGGATCLSVLTDEPFFQGADAYLEAARAAVPLPCLRKDFTIDPYQVIEARLLGADCILLIMAALDDTLALDLAQTASGLGLDVLVEVHAADELDRALRLETRLIGINNRNLKTLKVDLATTVELAPRIPAERLLVAESGLYTHADLLRMREVGARAFLVGESLMREADVTAATRRLLGLDAAAARMSGLSHFDAAGNAVMVDVTAKDVTERTATARGRVLVAPETAQLIRDRGFKKGDVLSVAQLAGIMGAKRTADLVPLCHPLPLSSVRVELDLAAAEPAVEISATCRTTGRTGVEMEALTAVSVAALTVYDMCKAVDRHMRITDIRLVHKAGGRSGELRAS